MGGGITMRSMSGFGRGGANAGGVAASCEARSVNHRFTDVSVSLPAAFSGLEPAVRREVASVFARGRVEVTVSVDTRGRAAARGIRLDRDLMAWYAAELKRVARRAGLGAPDAGYLAQLPGVVVRDPRSAAGNAGPLVLKAVRKALASLSAMRLREGRALEKVLRRSLDALGRGVEKVSTEWPLAVRRQKQRLDERLLEVLSRVGEAGKTASARELVAALERGDVTEELDRLRSHLSQVRDILGKFPRAGGAAPPESPSRVTGKRLDFLAQEVQRELNTIGAKAGDSKVVRLVVELKEEAERFREQVQNVE
jgi:uncharacterized protein (TIGR00255 family)